MGRDIFSYSPHQKGRGLSIPRIFGTLKVKVHTLDIAPLRSESPPQKRSGTARVLKGFHSFTCTPTRSSAIGMSQPAFAFPAITGAHLPTLPLPIRFDLECPNLPNNVREGVFLGGQPHPISQGGSVPVFPSLGVPMTHPLMYSYQIQIRRDNTCRGACVYRIACCTSVLRGL